MDISVFAYFRTSDFGSDFATKIQFGHGLKFFNFRQTDHDVDDHLRTVHPAQECPLHMSSLAQSKRLVIGKNKTFLEYFCIITLKNW